MLETCKSCGTVFEVDRALLSKNVQWLKCSVCNQKWSVAKEISKEFDKEVTVSRDNKSNDQSEKVKKDIYACLHDMFQLINFKGFANFCT